MIVSVMPSTSEFVCARKDDFKTTLAMQSIT